MNHATFTDQLARAIYQAGEKAKNAGREAEVKTGDGHRSIITQAHTISNQHILDSLADYPNAKFLCEEESGDSRTLSRNNPQGLLSSENAAVIDSLDGTTRFAGRYPDWCVAGGSLHGNRITSSCIFAPEANGGTKLQSSDTMRVAWSEGSSRNQPLKQISSQPTAECVILRGVDTELYANMLAIMPKIAASARAVYTEGSGLFGLTWVALGRAAAIIQTPQKAWDWVPAYHALTTLGGVFQFFRLIASKLVPVNNYDFAAFTYKKENRLGFVAGEPDIVEKLFNLLPRTGWERHDPDTI